HGSGRRADDAPAAPDEGAASDERAADGAAADGAAADNARVGGDGAGGDPKDGATPDDPALRLMLREMAAKRLDQLDALPPDVGGRIRGLEAYDFMEPAARDRFNALVERLRKQVLDQFVGGLSDAIKSTTPEDLAANREMVRDGNRLHQQRLPRG